MDYKAYAADLRKAADYFQINHPDFPDVMETYNKSAEVIEILLKERKALCKASGYNFTQGRKGKITNTDRHMAICQELNNLYDRKNADYGDSFHQSYLEEGLAMVRIRLGDKMSRFKTLTRKGTQEVKDESIRDTLMDLANYAIMTVMEMEEGNKDGC